MLYFFPELEMNKMKAWAKFQQDNGMIFECLGQNTCFYATTYQFDSPSGRVMADVTTGFILEAYQLYEWTANEDFINSVYPTVVKACQWQMNQSAEFGMPTYMENTYDMLNPWAWELVSYNGFMNLAAMRACEEFALAHNDTNLAKKYAANFVKGRITMESTMWSGSYFRAYNGGEWIQSDTLYGQVWAYTLGLGDLVNTKHMSLHLESEEKYNDSPYGLVVMADAEQPFNYTLPTNPSPYPFGDCNWYFYPSLYNSVWMQGSPDWSAINLHLGVNVTRALSQTKKALDHWRVNLRDLWNIHGITGVFEGVDGQPFITSHYGFYMVMWHIPFALSGQLYSAPKKQLFFDPKFTGDYRLPVLIPNIFGFISKTGNTFKLEITSGKITLQQLSVAGRMYPKTPITLQTGQFVQWN